MNDYFVKNMSKTYGASGNSVDYKEEWSGSNVKMVLTFRGSFKPDEGSGIKIIDGGDYLRYEYTNSNQDMADSDPADSSYANISQAMLSGVTFDYYLTMPGKITDSNANVVNGNKAEWHFNGNTMSNFKTIYAKSEVAKSPGFESMAALLALVGGVYLLAMRKKE